MILSLAWGGMGDAVLPNPPETMKLFDFNTIDEASWRIVNDGVMGGRSKGYVSIEEGAMQFTGTLVTRGGGFTSVRVFKSLNIDGFDGLEVRVRGGGRTFEVSVDDGTRFRGRTVSRRAPFETTEEWTWVRVPFSALGTTIFGRPVRAPAIDLTNVGRIGFFIADGIDGPFRLEVDEVRAYKEDAG
ncbi:MAG: CIA30 family protein [Bacteroidota bacterium]